MEKLETMLNLQTSLQLRLDPAFFKKSLPERVAFIKEHSIHLNQEINEALYELPYFKPWKDYSGITEAEEAVAIVKFQEEMIDAWHFFMNMMIASGLTAESFFELYKTKNKINHTRQDEGYTHTKSFREEK